MDPSMAFSLIARVIDKVTARRCLNDGGDGALYARFTLKRLIESFRELISGLVKI